MSQKSRKTPFLINLVTAAVMVLIQAIMQKSSSALFLIIYFAGNLAILSAFDWFNFHHSEKWNDYHLYMMICGLLLILFLVPAVLGLFL